MIWWFLWKKTLTYGDLPVMDEAMAQLIDSTSFLICPAEKWGHRKLPIEIGDFYIQWFAELNNLRENYICIYIYNSSSYGMPIIHGIINGKDWKSVQDKKCCCAKTNTLVLKRGTIPFFKWRFLRENHPATNQLDYQGVMGNEPWNMGQLWYELCCS